MARAVRNFLLGGDGGHRESLTQQGFNVELGQVLYLDGGPGFEDLRQVVWKLLVDGFDKLKADKSLNDKESVGIRKQIIQQLETIKNGYFGEKQDGGHSSQFQMVSLI